MKQERIEKKKKRRIYNIYIDTDIYIDMKIKMDMDGYGCRCHQTEEME